MNVQQKSFHPLRSDVGRLFFVTLFLLVFIMGARTPLDTDVWWQLRAGEETWRAGAPVLVDHFSFTHYGGRWINHSWLGQVFLYLAYAGAGYWGLTFLVALAAAGSLMVIFLMGTSPIPFRSFLIIFGAVALAPVWSPRPQVFSLFFLALLQIALESCKRLGWRKIWFLVILFVLWSNFHAGYSLGLIFLGCTILGEILNNLVGLRKDSRPSWIKIFALCGWTAACGIAVLLNPNGLGTWTVQFNTIHVGALQRFVVEWASPDFHDLAQQPFLWLLFATVLVLSLSPERPDGTHVISILCFAGLALMARRNIGPFALVAIPVLDRYGWSLLGSMLERFKGKKILENYVIPGGSEPFQRKASPGVKLLNLLVIALLTIAATIKAYLVAYPSFVEASMAEQFPVKAVQVLTENSPSGNLLNEYNWGGYLTWFSRKTPVFVDGRTDLFGDKTIMEWIDLIQARGNWEAQLDWFEIEYVLLQPDRPILDHLRESGWRLLYEDQGAVLYTRD
ncbi:MAG: hypothetical protein HPY59_10975 [Anaerolineae bacterium]|nr:hypothetical protein [Anaerolineae bacterium]